MGHNILVVLSISFNRRCELFRILLIFGLCCCMRTPSVIHTEGSIIDDGRLRIRTLKCKNKEKRIKYITGNRLLHPPRGFLHQSAHRWYICSLTNFPYLLSSCAALLLSPAGGGTGNSAWMYSSMYSSLVIPDASIFSQSSQRIRCLCGGPL